MSSVAKKLLEECLALPEDDRRYLVGELLASVDSHDPGWEEAWSGEAARRSQAADESGDSGRPWSEVKADLLAKLPPRSR